MFINQINVNGTDYDIALGNELPLTVKVVDESGVYDIDVEYMSANYSGDYRPVTYNFFEKNGNEILLVINTH